MANHKKLWDAKPRVLRGFFKKAGLPIVDVVMALKRQSGFFMLKKEMKIILAYLYIEIG